MPASQGLQSTASAELYILSMQVPLRSVVGPFEHFSDCCACVRARKPATLTLHLVAFDRCCVYNVEEGKQTNHCMQLALIVTVLRYCNSGSLMIMSMCQNTYVKGVLMNLLRDSHSSVIKLDCKDRCVCNCRNTAS